jgi:hypothetical protein
MQTLLRMRATDEDEVGKYEQHSFIPSCIKLRGNYHNAKRMDGWYGTEVNVIIRAVDFTSWRAHLGGLSIAHFV